MTADVHISAQSLIQGGEIDGERVDAFPAPETPQRVTGDASPMHEACQDVSAAQNQNKVHNAWDMFLKCRVIMYQIDLLCLISTWTKVKYKL